MRFSYRAAGPIAAASVLALLAACSRAQQDWGVAQRAGTPQAYEVFAERHSDSELAGVARQRAAQLTEEAAWQDATRKNTADAYQQYLAKYPSGAWSGDARIRMESRSMAARAPQDTGTSAPAAAPVIAPASPANGAFQANGASQSGEQITPPALQAYPATAAQAPRVAPAAQAQGAPAAHSAYAAPAGDSSSAVANAGRAAVQLGAFSTVANANSAWTQLHSRFQTELGGLTPQVVPVISSGRSLYRLETRVADQAAARLLCRQLQHHSQGCLPVP
jgi:hypothetical protein